MGEESACNAGDTGDTGSGRPPGGGQGNPSSSHAWRIPWAEEAGGLWVQRVAKTLTRLKQLSMQLAYQEEVRLDDSHSLKLRTYASTLVCFLL